MAQASPSAASPAHRTRGHLSAWDRLRRGTPWWALPVTVVVVLGSFVIYGTWTAFFGPRQPVGACNCVAWHQYLSPFFSPLLFSNVNISPALWVLPSPLLFRATCYYYRKAYYRSFFWDPPACAVGELRHRTYRGESKLPLSLNNLHRFAMYLAVVVIVVLWIDAFESLSYNGHLGFGLGSFIMLVNVVLLSGYTFSCHSVRHLVGGGLDCFSKARMGQARHSLWRWVTTINERHPTYAWLSLFSVVITDIYIRLLMAGAFTDPAVGFR